MNNVTVSVGAVTYAIKLKKLLSRVGVGSTLKKSVDKERGCVYGVEIKREDLYTAVKVLRENRFIYTVEDNYDLSR